MKKNKPPPERRPRGRPKGAKSRRTLEREAAMETAVKALLATPFEGNALALLTFVYRNQAFPLSVRIDAAKAAIRFESPPFAPIDPKADEDEAQSNEPRMPSPDRLAAWKARFGGSRKLSVIEGG